jgi:6-phosphogluconolactonase (cycloisomerase 2 family)
MNRSPLNGLWAGMAPVSLLRPLAGAVLMALSGVSALQAEELELLGAHNNADAGISAGFGGASGLAVSADNKYIYVAALTDKGLGFFKRDVDGQPSYLNFYPAPDTDAPAPVKVMLTSEGAHLYALFKSFSGKGKVVRYLRNVDGSLTSPISYESSGEVTDLAISSDGKNLYLSGMNSVVVYERDVATGELVEIDTKSDGQGGVDGIAGSSGLTLTSDGKYLFVAGATDNAVAVFTRSTTTGRLGFVEALRNDPGKGVTGLNGARSVALSPDGVNLYVAGAADNALAVFKRNVISGKVSYLEAWTQSGVNGQNMVPELDGVSAITVSPNGSRVYASSANQDVIAIFKTLPSRKLEFMEVQQGGSGMVTLAANPGGAYLYAVSPIDGAGKVTVFKTANSTPVAANDVAVAGAGSAITLNVLANDTDPDNDVLQLSGADSSTTQGGVIVVNDDGTVTYTAPSGYTGVDSFNYFVSDVRYAEPVVAQVSVTVTPVLPPVSTSTGGDGPSTGAGGGGAVDGWFGMLLLSVAAIRRRVVQRYVSKVWR